MLAKNPKTGGQIRILTSDLSIWKDSKTLVWMKEPFSNDKKSWKRWDILVTSVKPEFLAWSPDIVLLTEESEESTTWLKTPVAKNIRFILVSMTAIKTLVSEGFDISSLGNVICLDEFNSMYPFLGEKWSGTLEDAIVCSTIVFRYNRLIGLKPENPRLSQIRINDLKLAIFETHKKPDPLVLIQQFYKPKESTRQKELRKCLQKNLENPLIDKIILFTESSDLKIPADPENKIQQVPLKSRLSYANCIEAIQKLGSGYLVAFANADIYLDETWKSIWSVSLKNTLVALLRWEEGISEETEPTLFGPRNDSQDTWLIHSDSVVDRKWNLPAFNIPFGQAGCDNAILIEFLRNKFKIVNPALSLRTIHVHKSEIRHYDKTDIVDRPQYMFVDPTGIHELNPLTTWSGWAGEPMSYEPLNRPLKATTAKHLNMFCSQMNRDPAFAWTNEGLNTYEPPVGQDRPINISGGAFVSPSGLVYRHTDICVGTTDIQKSAWSENRLSHLMASYDVNCMMAFHLESAWIQEPALFTLNYLSKVIQQNKLTPEASFWCKKTNGLLAAIHLFKWEKAQGRLLEYSEQAQVFATSVVGRSCHGTRPVEIDIYCLRTAMNGKWVSQPLGIPVLVIVQDTYHMNGDLVEKISEKFTGYSIRTIWSNADATMWAQTLSGASQVILSSSVKNIKHPSWAWMWLAPIGCKILELQEEREPSDSLVHLAAASGQEWTLLQYPRSTAEGFKKIVLKEIDKVLVVVPTVVVPTVVVPTVVVPTVVVPTTVASVVVPTVVVPIIYTPPKSMTRGFFGHKGDSFREMIDLWEEAGYIQRQEDASLTMCWLSGVNQVLLYDRPTWNWLDSCCSNEQTYNVCLAGNPNPNEKPNTKPWIFWPREPRLVEEISKVKTPYASRSETLVFYGRIENAVQGAWREGVEGWQEVCSTFSMQQAKEPYILGPKEYLEALKNSKYGLCLRGFGPKCNREIELLAMGTVPIVTSNVDIVNYIEPLIDGIHIICVSGPEDAMEKISKVSQEKWLEISEAGYQWWLRNCSIEGSWLRTKSFIIE